MIGADFRLQSVEAFRATKHDTLALWWINEMQWMGLYATILAIWGRARDLSVTEAPHKIEYLRVSREETFHFFEIWMSE